jgi:hypothetical protein
MILDSSSLRAQGFWQLELLTFIRARVELRQHARTDTFNLRRVVRAVTRPFIQGARVCARVGPTNPTLRAFLTGHS